MIISFDLLTYASNLYYNMMEAGHLEGFSVTRFAMRYFDNAAQFKCDLGNEALNENTKEIKV